MVAAGVVTWAACDKPYQEFPTEQVCLDVGYAIAARTYDCEDSTSIANKRFDLFEQQYECLIEDTAFEPIDVYYHCVAQINATSCDDVTAFGDDLSRYMALSPACGQFLAGPGLTPTGAADAGQSADAGSDAATDGGAP